MFKRLLKTLLVFFEGLLSELIPTENFLADTEALIKSTSISLISAALSGGVIDVS